MKILVQKSNDRDMIGLFNALSVKYEVVPWDHEKADLNAISPDVAFFNDTSKLGYNTFKSSKKSTNVFIKCQAPDFCRGENNIIIEAMPTLADTIRYPHAYYHKSLAVDAFYLSNFNITDESCLQCLNVIDPITYNYTYRSAGTVPIQQVTYIGGIANASDAAKLCKSAGVCIDFGLECAVDLLKIGCRVITNKENTLDIPVFTPSTINDVIKSVLAQPKPVLNKYEGLIMSYAQFCPQLGQLIKVAL